MKKSAPPSQHQQTASHFNQALENHYQTHISTINNPPPQQANIQQKAKRNSTPPPFQTQQPGQQQAQQLTQGSNHNNSTGANNNSSYIQQTIIINSPNFNINYMQTKNNQYVKNNIDAKGNQIQLNTQNVNGNQYYSILNQNHANTMNYQQGQHLQNYQVPIKPNTNMPFLRSKSPLTPQQILAYGNENQQQKKQYLEGGTLPVQMPTQYRNDDKLPSKPSVLNDGKRAYMNSINQIASNNNNSNNNITLTTLKTKSPKSNDLIQVNTQQGQIPGYVLISTGNNHSRSESTQKQRLLVPSNNLKQNTQQIATPSSNNVISQLYKNQANDIKGTTSTQQNNQVYKRIEAPKQPQLFNNLFSPSKQERSQSVKQRLLNRPISQQNQYSPFGRTLTPKPELPHINDFKLNTHHQTNQTIDHDSLTYGNNQTANLIKQTKAQKYHTIGDFDDQVLNGKNTTGIQDKQLIKNTQNTAAAVIQRNQTIDIDSYTNQKLLANHLNGMSNTIGIKKFKLRDNILDNYRSNSQNAHRLSSCYEVAAEQNNQGLMLGQQDSHQDNLLNSNNSNGINSNSANKYQFRIAQERSRSPVDGSQQSNHPNQTKFSRPKSSLKEQPPYMKKRPISPQQLNLLKKPEIPVNLKQYQQTIGIQNMNNASNPNNSNNVQQLMKIYDETGQFKLPNPPKSNFKNGRFQRRYYSNVRGIDNRIKTEMNDSLTNSINILNLYNDMDHQYEKSASVADGIKTKVAEKSIQQDKQQNDLDKTIDKSFEIYFQEENKSQKFIRTNKDIQNFIKNDLRGIGPRDEKAHAIKKENYLNTKNNQQSRKHSTSHYIFSTLQENSQGTQVIQDFCYNFDIEN